LIRFLNRKKSVFGFGFGFSLKKPKLKPKTGFFQLPVYDKYIGLFYFSHKNFYIAKLKVLTGTFPGKDGSFRANYLEWPGKWVRIFFSGFKVFFEKNAFLKIYLKISSNIAKLSQDPFFFRCLSIKNSNALKKIILTLFLKTLFFWFFRIFGTKEV